MNRRERNMSLPKYQAIPFSVWYAENKEDLEKEFGEPSNNENQSCEECNGTGYLECNLSHEHECDECDGKGRIDLTPNEVLGAYALDAYQFRVSVDFRKWTDYNKDLEGAVCQ